MRYLPHDIGASIPADAHGHEHVVEREREERIGVCSAMQRTYRHYGAVRIDSMRPYQPGDTCLYVATPHH